MRDRADPEIVAERSRMLTVGLTAKIPVAGEAQAVLGTVVSARGGPGPIEEETASGRG